MDGLTIIIVIVFGLIILFASYELRVNHLLAKNDEMLNKATKQLIQKIYKENDEEIERTIKKCTDNHNHQIYLLQKKHEEQQLSLQRRKKGKLTKKSSVTLLEKFVKEKYHSLPALSEMYSFYKTAVFEEKAKILELKKNPSIKGAETVRECLKAVKESEKKYFTTLSLLRYYESLFPELEEFQDTSMNTINEQSKTIHSQSDSDPASSFLTKDEWEKLCKTDKFQISLERYLNKNKSKWEIGREYERFIGYEYESENWKVDYCGATQGLEDLGRDLIAKKGSKVKIIQCKYWAKDKTIHEKHIFQLYGTTILYMLDNRLLIPPQAVFVTSCSLSDVAKKTAKFLKIEVIENKPMPDYPRIKCNIGKDEERIYHLPFDQQYDKIKIEPKKGEFYCMTVKEAEDAGFRRANKWLGF